MSNLVTATIEIDAPPARVWEVMMDTSRTLEWVTIARAVKQVDDGPLRPGYRMDQTLAIHGVPFHVKWTLEEVREHEFARWVGKGPARSTALIEERLTPLADGGTHVDYRNEFKTPFGPLGSVASRVSTPAPPSAASNSRMDWRFSRVGRGSAMSSLSSSW